MFIRFGYDFTVDCEGDTPFISMLSPRPDASGHMKSEMVFNSEPAVRWKTCRDMFGNHCTRFVAPKGECRIFADAIMQDSGLHDEIARGATESPVADLPDECIVYLLGSRYCETDKLSQPAWDMFGAVEPGWARVQAICDYVNSHIEFDYMRARSTRTAYEAWQEKEGVCRDFAHLAIAFCRCMNIPARYVNGYLGDIGVPVKDPMDFSAWMEVYIGGRWHTFDPRNNVPRIGRIVVAYGRDAADVPLLHSFGKHTLRNFYVWTYEVDETGAEMPSEMA